MAEKLNSLKSKAAPSSGRLKLARMDQFDKDYRFYKLFAQIWGWDGVKAKPEKAVKKLCKYIKREERWKRSELKQRPMNPELQFAVGVAFLSGWIPDGEYERKAAVWFLRSAHQGCDKGALGIGYIHEHEMAGYDLEYSRNYRRMLDWYTSAAKQGNMYAQYRLANILYRKTPDDQRIGQLLMNAIDSGYRPAKTLFARAYPHTLYDPKYSHIYGLDWMEICEKLGASPSDPRYAVAPSKTQYLLSTESAAGLDYDEILLEILHNSREGVDIMRRVEVSMQMLQTSLNGMWKELREAEADHAEKLTAMEEMVQQNLKNTTHREMEDAEMFMAILFGDDWRNPSRLSNESCDALVSAHVLMAAADRLGIKNYAGIVITAIWALEHECRRRFRDAFDSYLESIDVAKEDRPSRMNLNVATDGGAEFTLGSVYFVVNPNKLRRTDATARPSEFDAFANATGLLSDAAKQAKKNRKYTDSGMVFWDYHLPGSKKSLTRIIYELNNDYRIPAAHAGEMSKAEAKACCQKLGITEAHKNLNNVEGALKALLWLTAPLK